MIPYYPCVCVFGNVLLYKQQISFLEFLCTAVTAFSLCVLLSLPLSPLSLLSLLSPSSSLSLFLPLSLPLPLPSPQLCLFAEGTRFTEEKHKISVEFAKSRGLPIFKHHLIPRTKGFCFLVKHLKDAGGCDYLCVRPRPSVCWPMFQMLLVLWHILCRVLSLKRGHVTLYFTEKSAAHNREGANMRMCVQKTDHRHSFT